MKKIVVAVDGTSGSGKSSTFKKIAELMRYKFLDTGLMYRAFTIHLLNQNVDFNNRTEIINSLKSFHYTVIDNNPYLNNVNIKNLVSSETVVNNINKITPIREVREFMVQQQRQMVEGGGYIVVGRDITSIVLPYAELKIFLDSSVESRAKRRYNQNLLDNIKTMSLEQIKYSIIKRDYSDKNRLVGPLVQTQDSWYIDNTNLSIEEVTQMVCEEIKRLELKQNE